MSISTPTDSIIDGVIESLQIRTPNGQTVTRLTIKDLISADESSPLEGSVMAAVDKHFAQLKWKVQGGVEITGELKQTVDRTFASMGQLSLIQQHHLSVGQLDNMDSLFALAASVARDGGLDVPSNQSLIACALYNLTIMDKKNRDYGSNNVSEYGAMGVLVRMRDKYHRAVRLQESGGASAVMDESLFDTWGDMSNYSRIGQAIALGLWKSN